MNINLRNITLNQLTRIISAILLLAIFVAALPQPAAAATPSIVQANPYCSKVHKVRTGDTIYSIAKLYGVTWQAIVSANNLKPPYTLKVGQNICIPYKGSPTMTVTIKGYIITIKGKSFPSKNVYYVRVGASSYGPWIRVGNLISKADGTIGGTFPVPNSLKKEGVLHVCLKNVMTNALLCAQAINK